MDGLADLASHSDTSSDLARSEVDVLTMMKPPDF
jgi:hypothetical protein